MRSPLTVRRVVAPIIPFVIITAVAETVVRSGTVPSYLLPAPSSVISSIWLDRDELLEGLASTTIASIVGLVLSFVLGTLFAIAVSMSRFLKQSVYPYAIFFQTVPVIAVAPLLVIWFGFGRPTVIASACIVSIFPIIASTMLGLESTDASLLDLFRLYSASGWDRLWRLRLPFALPQIFTGLRIASGLAVIGAIVGEFMGGGGLGAVVDAARTQQRVDKVFAAVLFSSILGLVMVSAINLVSWISLRHWHASARRD